MTNFAQGFLFDDLAIRGALVSIDSVWQEVHRHQALPPAVTHLMGQTLAATTLLAQHAKFEGDVIVQIENLHDRSVTPVSPLDLLVAKCRHDPAQQSLGLSATARLAEGPHEGTPLLAQNSRCVVSFDPLATDLKRYQSIMDVSQATSIALALESYMTDSVQIPTRFYLSADATSVRGLLLQQVADEGGQTVVSSEEDWQRVGLLADTVRATEWHQGPLVDLIGKVFWQENVRLFTPTPLSFHCSCSRAKVQNMLRAMGDADLTELLNEQEKVAVHCEFCGRDYAFTSLAEIHAA